MELIGKTDLMLKIEGDEGMKQCFTMPTTWYCGNEQWSHKGGYGHSFLVTRIGTRNCRSQFISDRQASTTRTAVYVSFIAAVKKCGTVCI